MHVCIIKGLGVCWTTWLVLTRQGRRGLFPPNLTRNLPCFQLQHRASQESSPRAQLKLGARCTLKDQGLLMGEACDRLEQGWPTCSTGSLCAGQWQPGDRWHSCREGAHSREQKAEQKLIQGAQGRVQKSRAADEVRERIGAAPGEDTGLTCIRGAH